jgi:hypothetical protein|tara:strand:- start:141940 stop:142275 length:336 start_codon:yes stop_codon:yes gene_type:complete
MSKIQGKEAYNYGFLFGLVREQLVLLESAKYKKIGVWKKARAASREIKIEELFLKIMKKKFESHSSDNAMNSLDADLKYMVQDSENWDDVDDEQASYIGDILRRLSAKGTS